MAKTYYMIRISLLALFLLVGCGSNAQPAPDSPPTTPSNGYIINQPQSAPTDNHGWGTAYDQINSTTGLRVKFLQTDYRYKNAFFDSAGNPVTFVDDMSIIYTQTVSCTGLAQAPGPLLIISDFPFNIDGSIVSAHLFSDTHTILNSDLDLTRWFYIDYLLGQSGIVINANDPYQMQLHQKCN